MKRLTPICIGLCLLLAACGPTTTPGTPIPPPSPLPTSTPEPTAIPFTPTPTPSGDLVVYEWEGDLWAYDGTNSWQLIIDGRAYEPQLSPNSRYLLFRRQERPTEWSVEPFTMWVLDLQTGQETQIDLLALPRHLYTLPGGGEIELPRWPYHTTWLPNGEAILFNTIVDLSAVGPGEAPEASLWTADPQNGSVRNLYTNAESPADFTLRPDGRSVLLNRPDRIEHLSLDTLEPQILLTFEPVATYSEYAWLPEPHWLPDGRAAQVAIAPSDPLASRTFTLWRMALEGATELLGQVEGTPFAWSPHGGSWSPDGTQLAYVDDGERVMLAAADGSEATEVAMGSAPQIWGWAPQGRTILYRMGESLFEIDAAAARSRQLAPIGSRAVMVEWLGEGIVVVTAERVLHVAPHGAQVEEITP